MPDRESISIIYSTIKENLSAKQYLKGVLESKANALVGFAGGMIALLLNATKLENSAATQSQML